jgi:hypothetical protein
MDSAIEVTLVLKRRDLISLSILYIYITITVTTHKNYYLFHTYCSTCTLEICVILQLFLP